MRTPIAAFAFATLLASTSAFAAQVTFDLSNPTGMLGSSHSYTSGGVSIAAYVEGGGELVAKRDLPEDIGVGLTSSPYGDGEITPGNWIAFDVSALNGDITFIASSTDGGDVFHLYESNAPNALGTSLFAGTGDAPIDLGALAEPYLIVTADAGPTGNGTVLASSIEGNTERVFEPGTLLLLGGSLLLFGILRCGWKGELGQAV